MEEETRESNKICGVCGDRALGYNFNAVSCESCKAFFRRNATRNKDFHCPFFQNCKIDPLTRRFCQKCRLDKCFSIGMLKESIMSEKDKALKRQKVEQNRAKRRRVLDKPKKSAKHLSSDEDPTLGAETSTTSSLVSESNFWELRKKVCDLESDRNQLMIDSPYDLRENSHGSDSKTLEMLEDSKMNFDRIDMEHSPSPSRSSLESEENLSNFILEVQKEIVKRKGIKDSAYSATSMKRAKTEDQQRVMRKLEKKEEIQDYCRLRKVCDSPQDFALRIVQNPSLLIRLMSNKSFARTIMTVASDPQILSILNENENENNNHYPDSNMEDVDDLMKNELANKPIFSDFTKNGKSEAHSTTDVTQEYVDSITSTNDILRDVQRLPITTNSIESVLSQAIKLEYSAYTICQRGSTREFNDAERAKLNELIVAHKALLGPLDDEISSLNDANRSDPALLGVINLTATAIRRLIKMAKKISAFKNMCQEDQVALLKGGCTEMMMLRSAINYDLDKNAWMIPHSQGGMSEIKGEVLKEVKGNLYAEHARFVSTFDPRLRDENIILILSAIALFTPDRPRVVHSDVIKLEQNSYYYLLQRYLESMYQGCEAKSMFLKLIQKISELHRLNDEVVRVYLNVNPSSVEPLLLEIFDLKH